MKIDIEKCSDDQAVVCVTGRLDAASSSLLREALKEAVETGLVHLVLDMHDVTFIDSSGLGALVSGLKAVRAHKGTLALGGVGQQIRVALKLTRLDQILPVYNSLDAALSQASADMNTR